MKTLLTLAALATAGAQLVTSTAPVAAVQVAVDEARAVVGPQSFGPMAIMFPLLAARAAAKKVGVDAPTPERAFD